ncbi:hypothetical protein PHYSODRAFT_482242 [Phytophthora sojae]|uniref:Tc1-like transposase DDE domain-containing protein n=1 Tax=Phytophthora sojae (strain P6497) TaxID=1094619 RepID=G4Z0Z3_PHYSP|nr:hypothetical protein PHYSODRAFT_482242 [Phytophthora sojae]EGZ23418.1 hypothetical protein PHYSODRAFT_482242 [Phytophthora sojae]|eukprot:XP_009518706.1 hypothetical protein PHYSODRAFT_482242 [Phytophthora sojae]
MQAACKLYGLPYAKSDARAIMWEKLSRHIAELVEPEIVTMAKKKGHEVVFTPPHYSDLQPIEFVWANVKGEVGRQYTKDTTFQQVRSRLDTAFKTLSSKTDQGCIDKARAHLVDLNAQIKSYDSRSENEDSDSSESDESSASDDYTS